MKRFFTTLVAVLALSAALTVAASASDYDAVAEELSAIGVFRGTAAGFELDRAPTRSEAAIMLVRLYGAEEQAAADYAAGTISHPFTDVSDAAAPYVAWLYTNGLTNGTTATTYGSASQCSAQQYVVFLLRALGYEDGTDFAYADALSFAASKGFFDTSMFSGPFLRDDLAAITYQALAADLKDGSTYLLASLIESGAVDAEAAGPITEKIETYRALLGATSAAMSGSLDMDFEMDTQVDVRITGTDGGTALDEAEQADITASGQVQVILAEEPEMAVSMEVVSAGETVTMREWIKDGWVYIQTETNGEASRVKYQAAGLEEIMDLYQQAMDQSASQMSVAMLPLIDTITARVSGGNTVYTLTLSDAVSGLYQDMVALLDEVLSEEVGLDMSVEIKECTYTYTVGADGSLKDGSAVLDMTMAMAMGVDGGEEGSVEMEMAMRADVSMTVNAIGDAVSITYPDFSDFQQIA